MERLLLVLDELDGVLGAGRLIWLGHAGDRLRTAGAVVAILLLA